MCLLTLLFSLQYLSESGFGNDNEFFITQPLSCFVFHLLNINPTLFSSVPPPSNHVIMKIIEKKFKKSWLLDYIDIEGTRLGSEISHTRTDLTA
jgi:hypothetical protein